MISNSNPSTKKMAESVATGVGDEGGVVVVLFSGPHNLRLRRQWEPSRSVLLRPTAGGRGGGGGASAPSFPFLMVPHFLSLAPAIT